MTDLEDAIARERSARIMHGQLCAAKDRGEPVEFMLTDAHTEWVAARDHLATVERAA